MNVINTDKTDRLHHMLSSSSRPVIVTHMRPDGDAIGSSMGMYHILKAYGRKAKVALVNPAPSNLDFLFSNDTADDILIHETDKEATENEINSSDLIICLDFNAFHRTDTLEHILTEAKAKKVLIDHHIAPDEEKFDLVFSKQDISSASELAYHIIMALPPVNNDASHIPSEAAVALMTGMTTDTNNFANSVYPSTFTMASELIAAGVDRDMIIGNIYNRFKESRIRLQGHMLKDLMQTTPYGVAYMVLDRQTMLKYNVEEGDTEGFVNIPLTIDGIIMSIFIKEDNGYARVSIRSKKGTSANRCARLHFHGGGHENAAGGRLYIPEDIATIGLAGDYIEKVTYDFINEENEEK
jgi:phosphoesterase RecJ-like protein